MMPGALEDPQNDPKMTPKIIPEGFQERWRTTSERSGDVAERRGSAPGAFQNALKTLPSVPRSSKSCREIAEESFCTKSYYLLHFKQFSLLHKNIR